MKSILSKMVLIAGVLYFVLGAAALAFGSLQPSQTHSIAALGIILVAAGADMKKCWNQEKTNEHDDAWLPD
ncbi:MAG: hypothetical protein HY835_11890 [Anaerolineae bacterium]|nr:hypothetical protein [Anaerolineae bacterium]